MTKPSIIEVVGQRIQLHKAGKEYLSRCPFHADKTPSFSVSAEKGLFYCFGCGESGDVFDFIMRLDGLTFPEAKRALGIEPGSRPAPRRSPHYKAATLLAAWLNEQHLLVGARCRQVSRRIAIAEDPDLIELLTREWEILADLHEDLAKPEFSSELWESRDSIEALTVDVELEPIEGFPPLTEAYQSYLRSLVEC
jgi:hypothetical protein